MTSDSRAVLAGAINDIVAAHTHLAATLRGALADWNLASSPWSPTEVAHRAAIERLASDLRGRGGTAETAPAGARRYWDVGVRPGPAR